VIGRPLYKPDYNNFAPNVGFAWDVFGNGKTAIRGGYSINYVNDELLFSVDNNAETNQGLSDTSTRSRLTGSLSSGLSPVTVPMFQVPRTFSDVYATNSQSAFGLIDPHLRTPYVQQYSIGIQHEIKNTILDLRYVGNHGTKELRAFDYNQVVIRDNGFLADFQRAQSNGNLARAATGRFDPRYNPAISGSQQLTVFPKLENQGDLGLSSITTLIDQGQAGELARTYQVSGYAGSNFFRNPYALGTNYLTNFSNSTYNSLQFDVRHRTTKGLYFQANYVFSKVLSDASGTSQVNFEPILDLDNGKAERARAPYDLTHVIKANGVYDLPIGRGHLLQYRPLDRLLTGWSVSGLMTWESGTPFSILSNRGTVNRTTRATGLNTADTKLNKSQLDEALQFRMTGTGPYVVAASAIGPDGRGVAADGSAPFSGQVFFNPVAGRNGALQRRWFSGPWDFGLDAGVQKNTKITERQSVELRLETSNALNHPTFYASADQNINSTNFGKLTSTFFGRRVVQFALYYRF
ncbi:MAG: hypothetical protein M3Z36_10025, partial [Acidobacteriota bacterium]|nr:hypothetical protein [Acidobacteriota bacterium]